MTQQLKLVLYKHDLELTPDEQATIYDEVSFYHEIHQDYFDEDDDNATEEERLIYEIENLVDPFIPKEVKTRTISFNRDHLKIIHDALYEKEELYSSTYDRYHDEDDLKVINKEGNLIGIWGDIYKKINEALNEKTICI
tara:strand:+ start:10 stop:426 length:417 start_codon:yes stop_codon:yes gene_type:complete